MFWSDNGDAGQDAAPETARKLREQFPSSTIRIATPTRPKGGKQGYDWDDALMDGADAARMKDEILNAAVFESESDEDDDGKEDKKKEKQALTLLKLMPTEPQGGLFRTRDHVGYADIVVNGHRETWRIRSTSFRRWLIHQFFLKTQQAPSGEAVRQAVDMVEAQAQFQAGVPVREVFVRVGGHGGGIYLDLCDEQWRAVEIDAYGWRIITDPPVRFRRAPGMLPLPEPQRDGSVKALRSFVDVRADDEQQKITDADFVLLVAWLLAAYRERGPYPILKIWGEPGSSKSTMTELLRSLTDPHKVTRRRLPREDRDLFIAANNSWVLSYDNVSHLPDWLSNALCTISTGGGHATRTLYTDQDEMLFDAMRPAILNGVENFITKHDLSDRMTVLKMLFIPKNKRRREKDFWAKFEVERPGILGALLDVVAYGLKMLPKVAEEDWPRMADFAHWITACEGALWEEGTFRTAYAANRKKATESAIEDDPVATALRSLVNDDQPKWQGTTARLLEKLTLLVGEKQSKSKDWPQTARALTGRLEEAKGSLRGVGITIRRGRRTPRGHLLTIRLAITSGNDRHDRHDHHTAKDSNGLHGVDHGDGRNRNDHDRHQTDRHQTDMRPSPGNRLKPNENDGRDGRDGHSRASAGGPYRYAPDLAKREARIRRAFEEVNKGRAKRSK